MADSWQHGFRAARLAMPQDSENETRTEPGASRHGNFKNYYKFHGTEERIQQLPRGLWKASYPDQKCFALDVGCNSGDLTYELYDFLKEESSVDVSLLGVDFDSTLIERARERNPRPNEITFDCLDFLSDNCVRQMNDYLGCNGRSRFDVAFCLSITMWIHLNYGDDGLIEFLKRVCSLCDTIVIEPQPWKCYRNASRRLRRARLDGFPLQNTLKLTGDIARHLHTILTETCRFKLIKVTNENDWQRKLIIYSR